MQETVFNALADLALKATGQAIPPSRAYLMVARLAPLARREGFGTMADTINARTPLRREITQDEVADTALFLASPLSASITGETIFVAAGFHAMGL